MKSRRNQLCVGNVPRLLYRRPSFVPPLCSTNPLLVTLVLCFFLSGHGLRKAGHFGNNEYFSLF